MTGEFLTHVDIVFGWVAVLVGLTLSLIPRAPGACRQIAVALSVWLSLRYLIWRAVVTLNHATVVEAVLSYTLFVAEIYGLSYLMVFYLQSWTRPPRVETPPIPDPPPTVDVFITVYHEPIEVLLRTAVCCTRLDYPAKTVYILDDGGRPEVRELATRLGCVYLHRPDREGAKAGNLNYGLAHSSGELVACFDVDHAPVASFLRETVGYFRDPAIALVQTPHHFINPDPFQRNLLLDRQVVNEQDLFFRVAMPGRDRWNAAFFCGSAAVLRRAALTEIGGFRPETVTEDVHTSLHLHAKGHRSAYVDRPLSRGLAPESFAAYLKQRVRWARGAMQALRLDNPLLKSGLNWRQRLLYFFAIYYFFFPVPRLIYTVAPLWFLLFGLKPLLADIPQLINYFLPQFLVAVAAFDAFAERRRSSFVSNAYELALSVWQIPVILHAFCRPRAGQFHVTPKGETRLTASFRWKLALPCMVIGLLLIGGILWGLAPLMRWEMISSYTTVNVLWATFHLVTCAWAIAVAYERPRRRRAPRIDLSLPAQLGAEGIFVPVTIMQMSETGSLVRTPPVPVPDRVELAFEGSFRWPVKVAARVVGTDRFTPQHLSLRVAFDALTPEQLGEVIFAMYGRPEGLRDDLRQPHGLVGNFLTFLSGPLRVFLLERALLRRYPRFPKRWRCDLIWAHGKVPGVTTDISEAGVRARFPRRPRTEPKAIQFRLSTNGKAITFSGDVRYWRRKGRGWVAGVAFHECLAGDLDWLREELYGVHDDAREATPIGS